MMHAAPGFLRRFDADAQFFQRRLRFDDDRIGAGVDQRLSPAR
jgi:hypothetical protein